MARRLADDLADLMAGIPALAKVPATPEHRKRFRSYLDLFLRWNRVHRMTALGSPAEIVRGLFVDSLLFFSLLPARPLSLVDIGAGSGIPGLPLRLVDDRITLTLVESKRKRVSFLLTACRELGLADVQVLEGRAEELIDREPRLSGSFDVAVARAVAGEGELFPLGRRYVRPNGLVILSGSPKAAPHGNMEVVKVPIPGTRTTRIFLRGLKHDSVPRGT